MASEWLWIYKVAQQWDIPVFTRLKSSDDKKGRALLDSYKLEDLGERIILTYETLDEKRLFLLFRDYIHLTRFMLECPSDYLHFHEVLMGGKMLKLYFDIDVEGEKLKDFNEEQLFSELIKTIIKYFLEKEIKLSLSTDLVILTSHNSSKKSYHIIVDNYAFANIDEIKLAIDYIKPRLSVKVSSWFDWGIYNPNKNLRIMGNYKHNSGRSMIFSDSWSIQGKEVIYKYSQELEQPEIKILCQYAASLITNTNNCYILDPEAIEKRNSIEYPTGDIDHIYVDKAMKRLANIAQVDDIEGLPFKFDRAKGELIYLRREAPSFCSICNRVHEKQHPYLLLRGSLNPNATTIEIIYSCRQSPNKLSLGIFPKSSVADIQNNIKVEGLSLEDMLDQAVKIVEKPSNSIGGNSNISNIALIQKNHTAMVQDYRARMRPYVRDAQVESKSADIRDKLMINRKANKDKPRFDPNCID